MFFSVFAVALLAEGVDRNYHFRIRYVLAEKSPSSRRAWIEISSLVSVTAWLLVALLAEGVDRNTGVRVQPLAVDQSPSSRRAWIEILVEKDIRLLVYVALLAEGVDRNKNLNKLHGIVLIVALLAEGVDRNLVSGYQAAALESRPPRGGRG